MSVPTPAASTKSILFSDHYGALGSVLALAIISFLVQQDQVHSNCEEYPCPAQFGVLILA
jgi:hypothetical protein